jgi:hypothetical protein
MDRADPDPSKAEGERARRVLVLLRVMPFGHAQLFDWWFDDLAPDGTDVDCFCNSWTRETLVIGSDGRIFDSRGGRYSVCSSPALALRRALPDRHDWLRIGGFTRGGPFHEADCVEDLAF